MNQIVIAFVLICKGVLGIFNGIDYPEKHSKINQNIKIQSMLLIVKDETFAGQILREISLQFNSEMVSVREIITERVMQEVEIYNLKLPEYFNGLIEPTEAEKTLNGYKLKPKKRIDGEKQVYTALDAFQKNGFFVLVDAMQAESLDQMLELKPDTQVSFIKLTPLVGG